MYYELLINVGFQFDDNLIVNPKFANLLYENVGWQNYINVFGLYY